MHDLTGTQILGMAAVSYSDLIKAGLGSPPLYMEANFPSKIDKNHVQKRAKMLRKL